MSAEQFAPIPRIEEPRITVRGLLERIIQAITEEFKRLNLFDWVQAFNGEGCLGDGAYARCHSKEVPACGTIGCIAGWGAILLRSREDDRAAIRKRAVYRIGCLISYDGNLFAAERTDLDRGPVPPPGTREHAEFVVARIRTYMKLHPVILDRVIDVEAERNRFQ